MPSYRFCRPDDIPYLVRAVNECYGVHFPALEPMTVERFRAEMKSLDAWPSNSLVASSEDGPIAVLIGSKRAREVSVLRLGVRPDHQRRGHGLHLVTSLSQKLAVLGPERLRTEVPEALPAATAFFAAAGYARETLYTDWTREPAPCEPVPAELVMPVTVAEIEEQGLLEPAPAAAWERALETLRNLGDELEGVAVASPESVEAYALSRPAADDALDVLALGVRDPGRRGLFLSLLLRHLASGSRRLRLPRLAPDEVPAEVLEALGFAPGERYLRFGATASPA